MNENVHVALKNFHTKPCKFTAPVFSLSLSLASSPFLFCVNKQMYVVIPFGWDDFWRLFFLVMEQQTGYYMPLHGQDLTTLASENTKAWAVSQHWHQPEHQGLGCVTTHWHQREHQGLGCVTTHWHQPEHQGLGCVTTHWHQPEHQGLGCVTTHWHQQEHQGYIKMLCTSYYLGVLSNPFLLQQEMMLT